MGTEERWSHRGENTWEIWVWFSFGSLVQIWILAMFSPYCQFYGMVQTTTKTCNIDMMRIEAPAPTQHSPKMGDIGYWVSRF